MVHLTSMLKCWKRAISKFVVWVEVIDCEFRTILETNEMLRKELEQLRLKRQEEAAQFQKNFDELKKLSSMLPEK